MGMKARIPSHRLGEPVCPVCKEKLVGLIGIPISLGSCSRRNYGRTPTHLCRRCNGHEYIVWEDYIVEVENWRSPHLVVQSTSGAVAVLLEARRTTDSLPSAERPMLLRITEPEPSHSYFRHLIGRDSVLVFLTQYQDIWNQWREDAAEASVDLSDASLRGDDLRNANLAHADFSGADLSMANLSGAMLVFADFRGASLRFTNFAHANLQHAYFDECDFEGTNFEGVTACGTSFQELDLENANFESADLQQTTFDGARLMKANFKGANLYMAQLQGACLRGASLEGADLRNANLDGADLRGVPLKGAKVKGASTDNTKGWPETRRV